MKKALAAPLLSLSLLLSLFFIHGAIAADEAWQHCKNSTLRTMSHIPGWCSEEKALLILELLREHRCQNCIEIGVFSGKSLFPIAQALKYNGNGIVYAIDAWDPLAAVNGLDDSDPNYRWWSQIDFATLRLQTASLIKQHKLDHYCKILRKRSAKAIDLFADATIDFIHFDGNHSEQDAIQDVTAYFQKVKDGGYMLLTDPNWISMRQALVYLLERSDLISPFGPSASYFLFRKNGQKTKIANELMQ